MSISTLKVSNPTTRFIEFKSDLKQFTYYDKEEKKNIEVPLPFEVVVLDELATIGGYSEEHGSGFYSNEVHNIKNEPLNVKTFKGGFSLSGNYEDIKSKLKAAGAKFVKALYVMSSDNELWHIKLGGAALGAWFEVQYKAEKDIIIFANEFTQGKKGKNTYSIPVFKKTPMKDDVLIKALDMDKEILAPYFSSKKVDNSEGVDVMPSDAPNDLPY